MLIVLQGDEPWAIKLLQTLNYLNEDKEANYGELAVFSDSKTLKSTISPKNYRSLLGTEKKGVIFSDSQFDIDAFAALSGTVMAGEIMFVVIDKHRHSNDGDHQSLFVQRFLALLSSNTQNYVIDQGAPLPTLFTTKNFTKSTELTRYQYNVSSNVIIRTQEQHKAVELITKVLKGHRDRPLVLTADRGRGKSTALAMACSELVTNTEQPLRIVVTAPHLSALNVFFSQLKLALPLASVAKNKLTLSGSSVEFLPLDELLKCQQTPSLVLVDEAAGFPVYLLEQLLQSYRRIVFSSTVHGYEGAGRGFSLKFTKVLANLKPNWQKFKLTEPTRWAEHDPLENFVFSSCLLNAEFLPVTRDASFYAEFELYTASQLVTNELLLSQIFAVLVTAHYQTSPGDLKQILDNDKIKLAVLKQNGRIIAVAMLMTEGLCTDDEVVAVKHNQRRLRDQFLPQSLLSHCGIEQSFAYSYLRVMRIAVHPSLQGKGIGGDFLAKIAQYANNEKIDFVGASFGANASLLNFWQQNGFQVARIGFSKDKASGENSALVLQANSEQAKALQLEVVEQFYRQFDYLLTDEYQYLSSQLVWQILHYAPQELHAELSGFDQRSLADFIGKHRLYSSCVYSLHQWLLQHCLTTYSPEVLVLIARVLQKKSVAEVCQQFQLTGKKSLNECLLAYLKKHY